MQVARFQRWISSRPWYRGRVRRIHQFLYNDATVSLAGNRTVQIRPAYLEVNLTKLKTLRKERGLTQEQLCEEASVSYKTVHRLESGWTRKDRGQGPPRGVRASTNRKLAQALDVEPSELVKAS